LQFTLAFITFCVRYALLARVVTEADGNTGRLQLVDAVIDSMCTVTSLCSSVRAVASAQVLQLLQLRRLPPVFISHCMQRLDPSDCGFINASVVRDFLCACSIVRVAAEKSTLNRVQLVQKSAYVSWLRSIQVICRASARLNSALCGSTSA
jgi:hypothetical protein